MRFVLLLQVCLLGLGLSVASPGRKFLMMFPPHNDPTTSHQVTITATGVGTSVTVQVLESSFVQHIFLSTNQSETIHLPSSVGMTSDRSSHLLSVTSVQPVTALASFCTQTGCDHSLLNDLSSWGTHYYPITPSFPNQTAVSQVVITSSDQGTAVDIFLSGEVLCEGKVFPEGSVLQLYVGALQSVYLQSNSSLSGSELLSRKAVGVVVGFTCSKHTPGDCLYGFAELKPVTRWSFDYIIPPLANTGMSSSSLLAISTINSDLDVTASSGQRTVSVISGVMTTIPIVTSDEIQITSDSPLQLIYFRRGNAQRASTLTVLQSVDDICQAVAMFDSGDMQHDNRTHTGALKPGVTNFTQLPDTTEPSSLHTDVGRYLSTMNRQLYPAVCEKTAASCENINCGHKRKCSIKDGKPLCALTTKVCSAWGDSYYRMFDGGDLVLLGNCNYTLVQTTCPGLNASVPLQIHVARANLNTGTVSSIHTVQISIKGFDISIVKEDKNHVRVNGQKRNLPLTMGNGSLSFYPSGSSIVLHTDLGLTLQYDWKHHLQVEVGPELYGGLCGLCGNANHHSSNGTDETQIVNSTFPWVVNGDAGICREDCGAGGVSCSVCTQRQTKSFPTIKGDSLRSGCTLLQRSDGPFADCHLYVDPEPFVRSCVSNLCVNEAASSVCKILTAYANICQRLSARVQNWRSIANCPLVCPVNSHYESCGTPCPATCANPEAPRNCSTPLCVESCQCNRGYLLSGGRCVPPSKCGCLHQGSYYLSKESFWSGEHCREKCVCQPSSKRVMCSSSHCEDGKVCKVLNGVLGCHVDGPGVCIASGDPHYTTFDGRKFDVYGSCTYLLTSHCPTWGDLDNFSIEVQNQLEDATNISFRHVKMVVAGYVIEMTNDRRNRVMVNGLLLRLPSVLSQGKVKLYMTGHSKCIETDFGLVVTYSSHVLTVQMPRVYSGNLCGLCGNFNSNPEDDLMLDDYDEVDISQAVRFWQTSHEHECLDTPMYIEGCSSQDMTLYEGTEFCGRLLDIDGAFQSCHETLDPEDFYDNCVHDLCHDNRTTLCQILSNYVAVCQEMGVMVDEWRAPDFCDLSCPSNSEYRLCSSHMSDCVKISSPPAVKCKEGCFCKPGFFHSGGGCVPDSECGCTYNDVYYEIHENFYPDEQCQLHCVCVGHNRVQCSNHTCPNGTKCAIQDGQRACHAPQPVKCAVMGGRHFRGYDGHSFDFNMGRCRYVLSQVCDGEESDPTVIIQQGQLHIRVHGVNVSLERLGKVKIDGVLRGLPVQLDQVAVLQSGSLTRVVVGKKVIVTYGGPDLVQIVSPASHRNICGLCGNLRAVDDKQSPNSSLTSHVSSFASSWSLSPPGTNCSEGCDLCSACNSTTAAEFASSNFCGVLLAPAGSFSGCHSAVDPEPFFQNCVNDLCVSNGNEKSLCSSLGEYTFACQEARAMIKPWRGDKCSLSCPENSHYNICVSACPESCGILSDIPCPWGCYEGCQCESGYMQSGNGCVKAEKCGCFYLGHYYEIGEISWAEGCSERCNCSTAATMCCEPASCPEGESCTLNGTWGCARRDDYEVCESGQICGVQRQPRQSQCWVLGGAHFYTFDGKMFEFLGNCTYTLVHMLNHTSENTTVWVGVQKDRTPNEASSVKALHVKVAEDNITIYRGGRGYASINGEKRQLPVTLQFGLLTIHQSGIFVVVDTSLGIQIKYDCYHTATILINNTREVNGMCGNNNGIKEDDLRTPQGEAVDVTTFGWSWRVPDQEAWCTADCGDACPRCSAQQLLEKDVAGQWISMHEYIWSPQSPFYLCREVVNYTEISSAVSMFDLCSSNDTQTAFCHLLDAFAAACQNAQIQIGEWRNTTFCPLSCQLNSHYESCGSACPATCEDPSGSRPCTLACGGTCQCDPGFVLDDDTCVPLSQCGCTHNGSRYHSNQTFWADEGCTERCVCDPLTHQTLCHLDSCGPDEYCGLKYGVRSCVPQLQQSCMYAGHHIVTFDQYDYDFRGTCQYQLLGMCGQKRGLDAFEVHVQTDGNLESALHVLVNVSSVLVELNSKNTESIEVNGVKKNMPYHSPTALVFSLAMHTYMYTDLGFELSLSMEGIIRVSLSSKYANATCGLCGNFNSDPADDLTANSPKEHLFPEHFGKAWRSGPNPWCVEGCLGGSCPNCSSERLARFSDPEACGKILEVNGPFRHCHGKVDPSSFYKRCVSDLCLHRGLQPALCHSLAAYAAVCLSHKAPVYAWRSPGFCYPSCPSSTSYNMSSASIHLCLGWQNKTVEIPPNTEENCICEAGLVHSGSLCVHPENCGCLHHGGYLQAGQKVSTLEQSCLCCAGGHMTCRNVSCGEDEDCELIRGVQGCHPKPRVAHCSVHGSQYTTFDGQAFEFHGSCNYTLVQTCLNKVDVEPILIAAQGNRSEGRHIYLQVNKMYFKMSTAFPGKIEVNGVYERLPFSQSNVTIHQRNGQIAIKTPQVELISDLQNHILVKIPDTYHQTTCGLCGNYNGDPSDDLQLYNGTVSSDPDIVGSSWKLSDNETSCNDTCDSACQRCHSPISEYTSDQYCGFLTHPSGPFSSCHHLVSPQKYYSLCMETLCVAEGQRWVLCDSLWAYDAACKEAGGTVDLWANTTGCAYHCPQFSSYSRCANACSSLCPEISQAAPCPRDCEEGCQCNTGYLYDGHDCVPAEQCGCVRDGSRFKASESKLLQNCTINCTCEPPLVCKQYSCPALHSCTVSDGIMGCLKDAEQNPDLCEGKCDATEKCYLSDGVTVCESRRGLCWSWGGRHYHTFDGLDYDFEGTCTYLLAASLGMTCGLTPFSVSKKNHCSDNRTGSSTQVVTVHAYGFIIQLSGDNSSIHVNGQATYIPVYLLRGKINVSSKEGKVLLTTDFGLHVVFDGTSSVVVTLDPHYKDKVYGLCGNFNGDPKDEYPVAAPGSPPINSSVEFAQVHQIFDGNHNCCTGCQQNLDEVSLPADVLADVATGDGRQCAELMDQKGPLAHCHSQVDPSSFYKSCVDHMHIAGSKVALDRAMYSYSIVCKEASDGNRRGVTVDAHCPPNSHYKTCGSACPPSCERNFTFCIRMCVQGCFCDSGFIRSQIGCVRPHQCGCTDSSGKYHNLNSTFWTPDSCGQLCTCGPTTGEIRCRPARCPRGTVCKQLQNKRTCQPENPLNCTIVTGLHFTTFDQHYFDFRDSCAYLLVQTKANLTGLTPFSVTISDASCHKRLFHSFDLTLSIYGLEVVLRKDHPGKVMVDGLYKVLPYSHLTGHVNVYRTPSSVTIHTDVGLQLIFYSTGSLMVVLPSSYSSSVSGLCGNANSDPHDDQMMPDEEFAQNRLEFAHSWKSPGAKTCRSNCPSRPKPCPVEAQQLFEGSDFCGVLVNELGPFADCASVLSPKPYFHSCVADSCSHGGHYSALCSSIASYAAACQAAQLPVRHWRSDTFCGMSCPKNSHYELCGPRCPAVCLGLSSPADCSRRCEEGCQCDPGYVLSNGQCLLLSECGCMHEGQYRPAGHFIYEKNFQKCFCRRGKVTCSPAERRSGNDGLALRSGVCQVLAGFGYITFDGVVVPHHGACTYVVSALSSKAMHDYTLLLSFREDSNGTFTISRIVFRLHSTEVSIDPETIWKIQVNGEERMAPFDTGEIKVHQAGSRLILITPSGVEMDVSSTQYLRLTVPQVYDSTASGLCGNFNGDRYDDLTLKNGQLTESFADFLHSWAVEAPGQNCTDTCGRECDECKLPSHDSMLCDSMWINSTEIQRCSESGVERDVYTHMCTRALCAGAGHMATCLALEAFSAACQAKGVPVGSWRDNAHCALQCPDRSSPRKCVESSSCPALLQPGSPAAGCSEGCECNKGNVFDGGECVPYSQCGCTLHDRYIKMDEQLFTEDCSQRCWCHPLGGVICEAAGCGPGQQCALRDGFWGCQDRPEVCELQGGVLTTLSGQQLSLEPGSSQSLMSVCDEDSAQQFSLIYYHGPCNSGSSSRLVTVFHILLNGSSFTIQDGIVKVNGRFVSLPHVSPSGVSLSSGVSQDKSEDVVILRGDAGMESELEMEIGVTTVTVKVPLWYSGKLCGLCGDPDDLHSHGSVRSWVLPDFPGCGSLSDD